MATLFCAAAALGVPLGQGVQNAVLLTGMILVGIPHGSFDHLLARPVLQPRLGRAWWAVFGLTYLGLTGLVCIGWAYAPSWTLLAFLATSVLHFGLGDAEDGLAPAAVPRPLAILAYGAMPVLLPATLHPTDAAPVLAAMVGMDGAAMQDWLLSARSLLLPWTALFAVVLAAAAREGRSPGERMAMAAACAVLPPLLAFAVYFTAGHAMRHTLRLAAWHDAHSPARAASWLLRTAAPSAAISAAVLAALGTACRDWPADVLAPMFQIIAALTLPHMVATVLFPHDPAGTQAP